jgi:hypothetical protein
VFYNNAIRKSVTLASQSCSSSVGDYFLSLLANVSLACSKHKSLFFHSVPFPVSLLTPTRLTVTLKRIWPESLHYKVGIQINGVDRRYSIYEVAVCSYVQAAVAGAGLVIAPVSYSYFDLLIQSHVSVFPVLISASFKLHLWLGRQLDPDD